MMFRLRKSELLIVALAATAWPCQVAARIGQTNEQDRRRLFGERISAARGITRGGVGGVGRYGNEILQMMVRIVPQPPTSAPTTAVPTSSPTAASSVAITEQPTISATEAITDVPATTAPTPGASSDGSVAPSASITTSPTESEGPLATLVLGRLNKEENNLMLSEGLSSTVIARADENVVYVNGESSEPFHRRPAAGDTYTDTREGNPGGWIYTSGIDLVEGGMGAITFNAAGEVIDNSILLNGTRNNNKGGKTPWNTWVSGEMDTPGMDEVVNGSIYQVDPFGVRDAEVVNFTEQGGAWQGFAYDDRDPDQPYFFMSEGSVFGAIRRFTPAVVNKTDPWVNLQNGGEVRYLTLQPGSNPDEGNFTWTDVLMVAKANAAEHYPDATGISVSGATLSFVIQGPRQLFSLDLNSGTYKRSSTVQGLMDGTPNEIRYVTGENGNTLLYMTESNGQRAGLHVRSENGFLYTVLEGFYQPLTAGFALSPSGHHLYITFQRDGILFDITRDDGLSFLDPPKDYVSSLTVGSQ